MSQKLKKKRKPNKESERQFLNEIESTIYNGSDIGDNNDFEDAESYLQRRRAWLYSNLSLWDILIDCSDVMEDRDETGYPLSASSKRLASIISNKPNLRESVHNYVTKGSRLMVQGRIMYGMIEDKHGNMRSTTSIVAEDVIRFA